MGVLYLEGIQRNNFLYTVDSGLLLWEVGTIKDNQREDEEIIIIIIIIVIIIQKAKPQGHRDKEPRERAALHQCENQAKAHVDDVGLAAAATD